MKKIFFISSVIVIILYLMLILGVFSNIQLKLADNLYGGKTALNSIVIIGIDDESLDEVGRWPWDRAIFARLLEKLNNSKVIGLDIAFFDRSNNNSDLALAQAINKANVVLASEYSSFEKVDGKVVGKDLLKPIEELGNVKTGYANIITDRDGVTRAINQDLGSENSFSYIIFRDYWKKDRIKERRFLVNYVGAPGSFKIYSLVDVLNEEFDKSVFENKIVLVGAVSRDLRDTAFVPTSSGKPMAGVEIHANAIQTLIKEDYLNEQGKFSIFILMVIFSAISSILLYKKGILFAVLMSVVLIVAYVLVSIMLFNKGIIMNLIYVPICVFVNIAGQTAYMYLSEKKSKKMLKEAFSKYVSSEVVEDIVKNPSLIKLGGEKKEITVFFSDIRGFTTISEGLKPEQLVELMNDYLSEMTKVILEHKGLVDKYIGDAIMAFWGAPIKIKNHAEVACEASLKIIEKLEEFNKKRGEEGLEEIKIGIGLNTGEAVVGNMGSYDRFNYTAMGDSINLGSRLEGLTKEFKVKIIISEETKKQAGNKFITRKLGKFKVKGKNKAVVIYELVGKK